MYYEINVSYRGCHLFATAKRSILSISDLRVIMKEIQRAFPVENGYSVTVTEYQTIGKTITEF